MPKKIPITFHNGSNYDYHFIIKELAEEFEKQFTCLGENNKKYITFTVLVEKKLQELIKIEKKLQKTYLTYYYLLTAPDLWEAHYPFLSITILTEFIKLNVNTDTMIKNVKHAKSNINIAIVFLNT